MLILVYVAFPRADYYAPSDTPRWHRAFVRRYPRTTSPLLFPSTEASPVFVMEDASGMMQVACCWRPQPFSTAPQSPYRGGQVDLYRHNTTTLCSGPYSGVAPTIAGVTGWPRRQGMPGAPVPEGLCTLLVNHHVIPQPSTTSWRLVSSAWCLSGVCCSRHRVVYNA